MRKLCRLAIPIAFLCFAWPAVANAEPASSGLSFNGDGGSQPAGGGDSGEVRTNDILWADIKNNDLTWDRAWSHHLIDTPSALWGSKGWCSTKATNYQFGSKTDGLKPYIEEITKKIQAGEPTIRIGDYEVKPQAGFKTLSASSSVIGSLTSGACASPAASWHYTRGGNDSNPNGGYGMNSYDARAKGGLDTVGAGWAFVKLKGEVANQVAWKNRGPVRDDLKQKPNKSGIEKPNIFEKMTGLRSNSEFLPVAPSRPGTIAKVGSPVAAVVRVWRECAHAYPSSTSGNTSPISPAQYKEGGTKCENNKPIYERTIPVVDEGPSNQGGAHRPYKGNADASTGITEKYNYWNVTRGADSYPSTKYSYNNSHQATNGIASYSDDAVTAGALFTSCSKITFSQKWCKGPLNKGDNTGSKGPGAVKTGTLAPSAAYQSKCGNGGQVADVAWDYSDYLAQIAYMYASGQSASSAGVRAGIAKSDKISDATFAQLFIGWNPVLSNSEYNMPDGSGPLIPGVDWNSSSTQPKGKWPQGISKQEACRLLNEWIAVDWNLQGTKEGTSTVNAQLNMQPNRLYVVQIVMLDSRENIISQSLQFLAAPASGQSPQIAKTWACPASLGGSRLMSNPSGLTEGQLREQCGSTPEPTCRSFDPLDTTEYPVGHPNCAKTTNITTPAFPPVTGSWDQYQPISQMIGQSCSLPCQQPEGVAESERYGKIRIAPSGGSTDLPPAGGTEGTPPVDDTGLWMPRHLKVSILNPDNNRKTTGSADDPHGYRSSHRIQVQNDLNPDSSMDRFKNSSQYVLDNNENDFSPTPGFWQAQLPLDAPEAGSNINLMGSAYSVAVSNPTRTPDTDQVEAAASAPDPVLAASQLQSRVDETRISTLLGEGHYPALTTTRNDDVNDENGTQPTTDNTVIKEETHRLTADSCPGGQKLPKVQNATDPARTTQACNPSFGLGKGWTVSDAYKLPIQSPGEIMELDASFANSNNKDGDQQDAYINLDSSDPAIKDRIATTQAPESADKTSGGIELWKRHSFLTRDLGAQPTYRLALNASNSTSLNLCKPIAPHYVQIRQDYTADVIKPAGTQAHHLSSDTISGMESNPGSLESDSITRPSATPGDSGTSGTWVPYNEQGSAGTVPSDLPGKRNVPAGSWARFSTSWPLANYDRNNQAVSESSLRAKGWNSGTEKNAPSWNNVKDEFGGSYKASTQGNSIFWQQSSGEPHPGVWLKNKYQHDCAAVELAGRCEAGSLNYNKLGSNWGRNPWNTFGDGGTIWGGGIDGKDWWFGPDDQQNVQVWEAGKEQRYRMIWVLAGDVGRCEGNPGTDANPNYPNANLINPDTGNVETDPATGQPVKAATLPAGDWVVRYQLTNGGSQPLPAVERWGISATYTGNESVKWVSRFDVTQNQTRTAIYRIRPSG